jgi:hypothetical protein
MAAITTEGKKKDSVVNRDPWHLIYRGVHGIRPLWFLLPYKAYRNDSMLIIL